MPTIRQIARTIAWPLAALLVLALAMRLSEDTALASLFTGWYELPLRKVSAGVIGRHLPMLLFALALSLFLAHRVMQRYGAVWTTQVPWTWTRSLILVGLVASSAAASIGLLVITHESLWLLREKPQVRAVSEHRMMQQFLAGKERLREAGIGPDWGRLGGSTWLRMTQILEDTPQGRDWHWSFEEDASGQLRLLTIGHREFRLAEFEINCGDFAADR